MDFCPQVESCLHYTTLVIVEDSLLTTVAGCNLWMPPHLTATGTYREYAKKRTCHLSLTGLAGYTAVPRWLVAAVMLAISLLLAQSSYHRAAAVPGLAPAPGPRSPSAQTCREVRELNQQPVVIRQGEGERERGKYASVFFPPNPRVRSGDPVAT